MTNETAVAPDPLHDQLADKAVLAWLIAKRIPPVVAYSLTPYERFAWYKLMLQMEL